MTDYTTMNGPELLAALGIDASKWADAFLQIHGDKPIDHGVMLGWFANAMMAMHDHLHGNPPLNGDHAAYLLGMDDQNKAPTGADKA
jgi:hypothetical protein